MGAKRTSPSRPGTRSASRRSGSITGPTPGGRTARGAVQAWDKLQPDDALIAVMGRALQAQVASKSWREGIGIPYAKRWLSNQRWKDSLPRDPEAPEEEGRQYGWH